MPKKSTAKKKAAAAPKFKIVYKPIKRRCIRAPGQTQTTISLATVNLTNGRALAKKDGRTFSDYMERLIEREWLIAEAQKRV